MGLYPHQIKALKETEYKNRVGYFLDMGLGKTFVGSEKAIKGFSDVSGNVLLIICQHSKIDDWLDHIRKYYTSDDKDFCVNDLIFDLTDKKQLQGFMSAAKEASQETFYTDERTGLEVLQENLYPWTVVGVINYELAFRRAELLDLGNFTLMLDESSMITNPTAKRTKFVLKLNPTNVILLSGTPTGGKYEKLWSQLKLLGWGISKKAFYQNYVITEWVEDDSGFKIPVIRGYKNTDRLKKKLEQFGCIFMKTEEVFDLPEMVEIPVKVKQTREFHRFMKNSIVTLPTGEELIGDTKLTKHLYARQLCGQYNPAKLAAFTDLVASTDDRLIVFYNFNDELAKMLEIVNEMEKPVSIVNGKVKDLEAYETREDSITFIQYQAGAMGLNLQKANKVVYFTLPQASDLFEQSKKRINRIGQTKTCFYYLLLCQHSVEEAILETLKQRKDFDDDLFVKYEIQY